MSGKRIFPEKLYEVLQKGDHKFCLRWTEDGTGVLVTDRQRLTDEVLPSFFNRKITFLPFPSLHRSFRLFSPFVLLTSPLS